ncbi:DUF3833 domain-containing protein [Candidatus Puniceispirillum marinum]|uniref:Putative lipoprotein n=1 Tax=Puniceispirillum marinum (strain IMCC1322) TaxID=488538 RepID=D5BN94_PUNMI|nr:DUF3833 domain-containing protein [Candidatus Puniceispirillum marinum]ADE40287.1 putative lipoprotein [Candidatus Puniceispirillum marinum IMCC1322]
MRRNKATFTKFIGTMSRLLCTLAVAGAAMVGLSSCAQKDVAEFADRQPALMLEQFFDGQSIAYGIFEDRFGNVRRQFRVNLNGRIDGNVLTLDEDFLYDDGERANRIWTIVNDGKNAAGHYQYQGTADDITGTATGVVAGNTLNWSYDVVLNMSGNDVEVHFDDWIYKQDEDVAINRAYISKYGIEIGSVTIVFLRGQAATAVGPLDLSKWPE